MYQHFTNCKLPCSELKMTSHSSYILILPESLKPGYKEKKLDIVHQKKSC